MSITKLAGSLATLLAGVLALGQASAVGSAEASEGLSVGRPFDVTPGLTEGDQRWPAVAFGKDTYLVVWQEGAAYAGEKDTAICAARISADGKPLDARTITVCPARGFQIYPAVAFDGTNFVVAWQDYRSGKDWDVYAARVSPDGKLLDAEGIAVADAPGNQVYPALASDGKRCFMVWSDLRPQASQPEGYGLSGAFLTDGKPQSKDGKELMPAGSGRAGNFLTPLAAYDGDGFVVAANAGPNSWSPGASCVFRVSSEGVKSPHPGGFQAHGYSLAADPAGKRLLFWSNVKAGHGAYQPYYPLELSIAGKETTVMVHGLQTFHNPFNAMFCAAVYDGKGFLAVVEQSGEKSFAAEKIDLIATRVSPQSGQPLDLGYAPGPKTTAGDIRGAGQDPKLITAADKHGIKVAAEPNVPERHPVMASSGDGRSLLVYERHGGIMKYKVHAVLLSE
jgi:hypothetical protein